MGSHDEPVSGGTGNNLHPGAASNRPLSNMSASSHKSVSEKRSADLERSPNVKSVAYSSAGRPSNAELRECRREVRTLPSWVQTYEMAEEENAANALLPSYPNDAQVAQHNHTPAVNKHPGRLYDSARERTPVMMKAAGREHGSRWRTFIDVSAYPSALEDGTLRVDEKWLAENGGDLDTPWKSVVEVEKTQHSWYRRVQSILLKGAAIPLFLRTIVWTFSVMAMAFACSIYVLSRKYGYSQRPSTIMAIVLDTLALVYVLAVTYDEYSGQPIGLRSAKSKMRLILLDLWFIIFGSANLSLAFDAISDDRWGCHDDVSQTGKVLSSRVSPLCHRQEALSGILLIALLAWVLTFTVSVFRSESGMMMRNERYESI